MNKEIIKTFRRLGVVIGVAAILTGAAFARGHHKATKGDYKSYGKNVDLLLLDIHARDARRSGMVEAAAGGHYSEVGGSRTAITRRSSTLRLKPHALIVLLRRAIARMQEASTYESYTDVA